MTDILKLKDKVVLITGSTKGIGKVIAESFAEQGAKIVINSEIRNDVETTVREFKEKKYSVTGISADVGEVEDVSVMTREIVGNFGRIDILVNNAALRKMSTDETIEKISDQEWDLFLRTNLKGIFNTCQAAIPLMQKQRSGSIVNISSQAALFVPYLKGLPYITSKGGVISFTKGLAREVGKFHVRVNALLPGFIKAEQEVSQQDSFYRALSEDIYLCRRGLPSEVANVCLFLSSDMASYITGEVIAVNGGMPSMLFM